MSDRIVDDLISRAVKSAVSARLLLDAEDPDGACNRAYYAMFHAARAALIAVNASDLGGKSHGGLIAAFGLRIIKTGLLPIELGRSLNHAEHVRIIADYRPEVVDLGDARAVVDQADHFVQVIRSTYGTG